MICCSVFYLIITIINAGEHGQIKEPTLFLLKVDFGWHKKKKKVHHWAHSSMAKSKTAGFDRLWSRWCPPSIHQQDPLHPNHFITRRLQQPCLPRSGPLLGAQNAELKKNPKPVSGYFFKLPSVFLFTFCEYEVFMFVFCCCCCCCFCCCFCFCAARAEK